MQNVDPKPSKPSVQTGSEEIKSSVVALWGRFRETMFVRLEKIEQASRSAWQNPLTNESRVDARDAAHKLAGALGTFGLPEGSKIASRLELIFDKEEPLGQSELNGVETLARELREEMERGPA